MVIYSQAANNTSRCVTSVSLKSCGRRFSPLKFDRDNREPIAIKDALGHLLRARLCIHHRFHCHLGSNRG